MFRTESDVLGKKRIPSSASYGIQTARAIENFSTSDVKMPPSLQIAMLQIKIAAAHANYKSGALDKRTADIIIKAGKSIIANQKKYESDFMLGAYQAGAGTPWHMNINEVIANVALKMLGRKKGDYSIIGPHNHVNCSQSTNDVVPTAMRIAALQLAIKLESELKKFISVCRKKGKEFHNTIKSARTHLQDAVPITLGLEFDAWASDIAKRLKTINFTTKNLQALQIGGSAVGTGINTPPNFAQLMVAQLKKQTGLNLHQAKNKIEETQFMSDFLDLSSALRTLATDLNKIANDIRLLSSGPMTGLNEISLPRVGLGSSIMPFKFNPSMAEMLNMVCFQVMGNDETIQQAAEAGQLELNVMTPVIAHNLLQSIDLLTSAIHEFTSKCLSGITANKKHLKFYFENSSAIATVLSPIIGYDKTALLIKESQKSGKKITNLLVEKRLMTKKQIRNVFSRKNLRI